ncbi:MAG: heparinase II/III family protein, partial [Balneolaceae bacterium]
DTGFMDVDIDQINEGEDRTAEALTGGPYAKNSESVGIWRNPTVVLGEVITEGSFRYAFTGDEAAGEKAKEALLKFCSFEKWNAAYMLENKFWTYYPVGYMLKPVAYGYDMLHDLLSEEEKQSVRDAIMEKGLKLFHRDMVEMNRMPSSNTNHIAVIVSGHGLAATAIYGDEPDNPAMEPYLSGIMAKAKAFIDQTYYEDGSYGEPFTYQAMGSRSLVEIFAAFERNFGVDWSTTTDVQHFYKYPMMSTHTNQIMRHPGSLVFDLLATHTSGGMPDYGDAGSTYDGFTQPHSWWFIYRLGNPFLYHYAKPYWEEGNGGYMSYLWFRDDITPRSRETFPTSRKFKANGMIMRSGWEDESTIITTRTGPHANHYHFDQGSFQIMTNGDALLDDPGVGPGGYYTNLEFRVYNIHSIAHNVMLIDHDPESQKPAHFDNGIAALRDWPRMTHTFAGEIADAVEEDLATVYKDKLESYTRTLLYTKSGPLFLLDRVKSNSSEGHVFNWIFHSRHNPDGRSLSYENNRVFIDRPDARLTMDILSPDIESAPIRDALGAARGGEQFDESFISLNSRPGLTEANFLAVLLPEARPSG